MRGGVWLSCLVVAWHGVALVRGGSAEGECAWRSVAFMLDGSVAWRSPCEGVARRASVL